MTEKSRREAWLEREENFLLEQQRKRQAIYDRNDAYNEAESEGRGDERVAFDKSTERFFADFSYIAEDPALRKMAQDLDDKLVAEGDTRPYWIRHRDIGVAIYQERGLALPDGIFDEPESDDASEVIEKMRQARQPRVADDEELEL